MCVSRSAVDNPASFTGRQSCPVWETYSASDRVADFILYKYIGFLELNVAAWTA